MIMATIMAANIMPTITGMGMVIRTATATAPAAKASSATCEPRCERELKIITGSGWCFMMSFRKVRPSIFGISMSSVMTSGLRLKIRSRAA